MSSLISPKLCSTTALLTCKKTRYPQSLQIRSQIRRDHEGRSSNIVDANLHLLKVRMEEVRRKDRVERCSGWNYAAVDTFKSRSKRDNEEFVEVVGVVGATFGLTLSTCTLCLCLISFLIHFNQL